MNPFEKTVLVRGSNGYPNFNVKYDPNSPSECKRCGSEIYYGKTCSMGKDIKIEFSREGWHAHYPNCDPEKLR